MIKTLQRMYGFFDLKAVICFKTVFYNFIIFTIAIPDRSFVFI